MVISFQRIIPKKINTYLFSDMDKEVLEVVLKRLTKESNIAKVIEMETKSALPKGENYMSNILAVTLKVVLGNGRLSTKKFIMKQMKIRKEKREWDDILNVAKSEFEVSYPIF